MKIVFTTHTYWPRKDGVQYVTQYLAEGLAKQGHKVIVFTPQNTSNETIFEIHNEVCVIRPFFAQKYTIYWGKNESYKELLLRECEDANCLINCAVQSPFNNFVLPLLKVIPCGKILYLHGGYDYGFPKNLRLKAIIKKILLNIRWYLFYHRNAKRFSNYDLMINITNDNLNDTFFTKLGVEVETRIVNNAVEDFSSVYASDELYVKYPFLDQRFFLDVANFNERKNQIMLIKAFDKYQNETHSDIQLVLVGGTVGNDGKAYVEECKALISDLESKDQIYILENLSRDDTRVIIKKSYCATMTSTYEVYPIFLAEALTCAHPFISTNVGSVSEMKGGLIVETVHDFAEKMKIIDEDKELYNSLSCIGKKFAEKNFSQEEKISELERMIRNLKSNN